MTDSAKFELIADVVGEGQRVSLPLKGVSMEPLLREGRDTVVFGAVGDRLRRGDVYLFKYRDIHIMHRLLRIGEGELRFQGDNAMCCEVVPSSAVKARMVAVWRNGREISCDSFWWRILSLLSCVRGSLRRLIRKTGRYSERRRLMPWYLAMLAVLMWAPLNGLGVELDNFVFGIRADHLLHASVYLPCAFFMAAAVRGGGCKALIFSVLVGVVTECVQYLLPYRGFDVNDMIANFLGATIGWLATRLVDSRHPGAQRL